MNNEFNLVATPKMEDQKFFKMKLNLENDISAIKVEHPNNFILEDHKLQLNESPIIGRRMKDYVPNNV